MGIAFGILSLVGTEPAIDLGVIYPNVCLKNTIAKIGLQATITVKVRVDIPGRELERNF